MPTIACYVRPVMSRTAAALFLLGGIACGKAQAPAKEEKSTPMVVLYGVRLQSFKGSELTTAARAARVSFERQGGAYDAQEVLIRFPQKGGASVPGATVSGVEVRAPQLKGDVGTRVVEGEGGVTVRSASGMHGQTEAARFDGQLMQASGKHALHLETPGTSMDAVGFQFYFEEERFTFGGEVVSRLIAPDAGAAAPTEVKVSP